MSEISGLEWNEALERCKAFLVAEGMSLTGRKCLLAVSGGMDSMCMMRLIADMKVPFGVAHVNYGLRGAESEADAELVSWICDEMQVTFHLRTPDLRVRELGRGESLQQYGRRLRYEWFSELCGTYAYDYLCTAHHQDDDAETLFINLLRGTGLKGLTGIPVIRENIVRPMLCFTRDEIAGLVRRKQIPFRNDASNFEDDYLRNRFRHEIIPWFQKERPGFISRMHATQQRLFEEYKILKEYLRSLEAKICREDRDAILIDRAKLKETAAPSVILHHVIQRFGFSWDQCVKITSQEYSSGAKFLSSTHQLIADRNAFYVISPGKGSMERAIVLEGEGHYLVPGGELIISRTDGKPAFNADRNIEYIDGAQLSSELCLRSWKPGDVFYPINGRGKQKLQDFFTNEKVAVPEKDQVLLLVSGEEIVWVVGMRLDHRYRVTADAWPVIRLEWRPAP